MASGVRVGDECKKVFDSIKRDKKYRFVIFYIKDEQEINVEYISSRDADYEDFLERLEKAGPDDCRYAVYDLEYYHATDGAGSSKKEKLFLMSWCPDTAKIKKKMIYASSLSALKRSLVGVNKYIQATDMDEASRETVEEKLRLTDRV